MADSASLTTPRSRAMAVNSVTSTASFSEMACLCKRSERETPSAADRISIHSVEGRMSNEGMRQYRSRREGAVAASLRRKAQYHLTAEPSRILKDTGRIGTGNGESGTDGDIALGTHTTLL